MEFARNGFCKEIVLQVKFTHL